MAARYRFLEQESDLAYMMDLYDAVELEGRKRDVCLSKHDFVSMDRHEALRNEHIDALQALLKQMKVASDLEASTH